MTDKLKRRRATKEALQERIQKAFAMLRQGMLSPKIQSVLMEMEGISPKTAYLAVKAATELIECLGNQSVAMERGLFLARTHQVYGMTITGESKNLEQAIKVLTIQGNALPKLQGRQSHHGDANLLPQQDIIEPRLSEIFAKYSGSDEGNTKSTTGPDEP